MARSSARSAARRRPPVRRQTFKAGPFRAVFDTTDPGAANPSRLFDGINVYVPDAQNGSPVLARPGMVGLTSQIGQSGARTGQGVYTHVRLDGTVDRFVFCGGKMYRWDGSTTLTDITPAGVTIDAATRVFCASFADELIVTDGVNKPFRYAPATGTATAIEFNAVPDEWCAFGPPVVYSGKLFFILDLVGAADFVAETAGVAGDTIITETAGVDGNTLTTEPLSGYRNTLAWSEEADASVGYQQSGYANYWELTQTSSDTLTGLSASELGLYYFRPNAIGVITGTVNANFQAAATRESISTTVGCGAPATILQVDGTIYFADRDGRPYRLGIGSAAPEPLYLQLRREVTSNVGTTTTATNVQSIGCATYYAPLNLVLYALWSRTELFAFDARTGGYVGTWTLNGGAHVDTLGAMRDSSNRDTLMMLGTRSSTYSSGNQGYVWRNKFADDTSQWLDQEDVAVASYTAVTPTMEFGPIGGDPMTTLLLEEVRAALHGHTSAHSIRMQYLVPGSGMSSILTASSTACSAEFGATDSISNAVWGLGPSAQGTYARIRLASASTDDFQFGVHAVQVAAQVLDAFPGAG